MGYRSLPACLADLQAAGQLVRVEEEVDPCLEAAEIQRRVCRAGGPAVLLARVKGCSFPMVCNLLGTIERARFLFRDALDDVRRMIDLKIDPAAAFKRPLSALWTARNAWHMRPKFVSGGPVLAHEMIVSRLPQQKSWPDDAGAFITLPQVYTEDADRPGWRHSNLGMYRIQLSGGRYEPDAEVGLHYQIHRGIGVHHAAAIRRGLPFRVNVFVGGPPAMTLAAVMPLPEGMSELSLAGLLNKRRVRLIRRQDGLPIHADADFCITGAVIPDKLLPEGPFGDHLGYYSLAHDFPVLRVDKVFHRKGAVWPFTVVGRPPQEDTTLGKLIHELTGPVIPRLIPGVRAVHAVDAAGVHPLLLAIGSERYVPYDQRRQPREILTQANAILGQGQLSLAKYLFIAAGDDDPRLDIHDVPAFLRHVLSRFDPARDLHFQTRTTIDTLDYSGTALNEGSKVVVAAAGPARRELPADFPRDVSLPNGLCEARVALPGILVVKAPPFTNSPSAADDFCRFYDAAAPINRFPLVVLADDSQFTAATPGNFLWVTFTRSNPEADVYGIASFVERKHWGCRGSVVIDARTKPHHAPPLVEAPEITRRVDRLAAPGGPLHGII
ncbi:MAG: UbiD family decarboxylase [Planctomycetia bacterium]|nr:UbiD family decarboxylase [Planctomycetia bacterium]